MLKTRKNLKRVFFSEEKGFSSSSGYLRMNKRSLGLRLKIKPVFDICSHAGCVSIIRIFLIHLLLVWRKELEFLRKYDQMEAGKLEGK